MNQRAFSIVEIVVSLLIVVALGAVGALGYTAFTHQAEESALKAQGKTVAGMYTMESLRTGKALDVDDRGRDYNLVHTWDGEGVDWDGYEGQVAAQHSGLAADLVSIPDITRVYLYQADGSADAISDDPSLVADGDVLLVMQVRGGGHCFTNLGQDPKPGSQGDPVHCVLP